MKVLIFEPNGELQRFLMDYLLRNKFQPQVVDRESDILRTLSTREFPIFISDYTKNEEAINDVIFNLQLDDRLHSIKVFITTSRPEKEVLQTLIELGVNGFIKKPFTGEQFGNSFDTWLNRNSFKNNKRTHTRITPAPADNAFLFLRPEALNRDIPCEIADISVGGIGALLPRSFERFAHVYFPVNEQFKKCRLKIRQVSIRVNVEVVAVLHDRVGLKFSDNTKDTMKYIYHYITEALR